VSRTSPTPLRNTAGHDVSQPGPSVPALPVQWLPRPRLTQRLEAGRQRRLTVVIGAPGAGKTTLLVEWAADLPLGSTAWLGLEEADNEPPRFWAHLRAALQCVGPALGRDLLAGLDGPGVNAAAEIDGLLEDVKEMPPAVLVVDDFHLIKDPAIVQSVERLVRGLPAHVRVVLTSRQEPGFPLHRMRVRGELIEIRDQELRFTVDEAEDFLALAAHHRLSSHQMAILIERTEGWATGLRLAALALAEDVDPFSFPARFGGQMDLLAEYLNHEILGGQSPGVIQFLVQTSLLRKVTGQLCNEITGRQDSEEILRSLASQNLLVVKTDSQQRWYRYHRLLLDLLHQRLEQEDPDSVRNAHLRAARWFERSGSASDAIHHLVQAGRYDAAFCLAASTVATHLYDGLPRDQPLLPAGLPGEYFEADPYRMYLLAAALLCNQRSADAARWLNRLDRVLSEQGTGHAFGGRIEFLWALHDAQFGEADGVLNHCQNANVSGTEVRGTRSSGQSWLEAIDASIPVELAILAARAHLWRHRPVDARAVLAAVGQADERSPDVALLGTLARVACSEGRLRDTYTLGRLALEEAERKGRTASLVTLDARIALGTMFWEQDELAAAANQFHDALGLCRCMGFVRGATDVENQLVRVMVSRGDVMEAMDRIGQLRQAERRDPLPDWLRQGLDEAEIHCRLALCDLDGAGRILQSLPPEGRKVEILALMDLFAGRPDRAVRRLTPLPVQGISAADQVERLALLARAQLQLGNRRHADDAIRRAIDQSREERFIRRLIEHAGELRPLLVETAGRFPDLYVADLLAHAKRTGTTPWQETPAPVLEPLTDRERQILSQLTGHLTQQEIACGLYVSVNTLKTHINRVYRKLGACSRSQAVALARAHGLV
jgi:LuxR family transcriptional regulator, maltose regulon positive regulatory protein